MKQHETLNEMVIRVLRTYGFDFPEDADLSGTNHNVGATVASLYCGATVGAIRVINPGDHTMTEYNQEELITLHNKAFRSIHAQYRKGDCVGYRWKLRLTDFGASLITQYQVKNDAGEWGPCGSILRLSSPLRMRFPPETDVIQTVTQYVKLTQKNHLNYL